MTKILDFTGKIVEGVEANDAARADAKVLRAQARSARQQALQDEYAERRHGRQFEGYARAAAAQAGGGEGGTTEMLLEQNAILAELDALNIRYQGDMRARGLMAEAKSRRRDGKRALLSAGLSLLAGSGE